MLSSSHSGVGPSVYSRAILSHSQASSKVSLSMWRFYWDLVQFFFGAQERDPTRDCNSWGGSQLTSIPRPRELMFVVCVAAVVKYSVHYVYRQLTTIKMTKWKSYRPPNERQWIVFEEVRRQQDKIRTQKRRQAKEFSIYSSMMT